MPTLGQQVTSGKQSDTNEAGDLLKLFLALMQQQHRDQVSQVGSDESPLLPCTPLIHSHQTLHAHHECCCQLTLSRLTQQPFKDVDIIEGESSGTCSAADYTLLQTQIDALQEAI